MANIENKHLLTIAGAAEHKSSTEVPFGGVTSSYGEENDWNYFFNQAGSRGPKGSPERKNSLKQQSKAMLTSIIGSGSETPGYASVVTPHLGPQTRRAS